MNLVDFILNEGFKTNLYVSICKVSVMFVHNQKLKKVWWRDDDLLDQFGI